MRELLIGCGSRRERLIAVEGRRGWEGLVTLDRNADHHPDVVHDLELLPLPFPDDSFDEIHAYEVLEHLGRLGDAERFLGLFAEFWRILAPGGYLAATSPSRNSVWAFGDPGHTRIIQVEQLVFLDQSEYARQVGVTPMSDYRNFYKADFSFPPVWSEDDGEAVRFVLRAVKPSRLDPARQGSEVS